MGKEFIVEEGYEGYVFVGWAAGQFEADAANGGKEMKPYANMYVLSPVSTYQSDDYQAFGYKAEKKKCVSPAVWNDLEIGCKVRLFFDDKQRVVMAAIDQ